MRAARAAIDESGAGAVLTARSEGFAWGRPDPDQTVRRLVTYAEAGADCLCAPFLTSLDRAAVVAAGAEAAAIGGRRISVRGMLAKTAWRGFLAAAHEIADQGTFAQLAGVPDLNAPLGPG